MSHDDDVVPGPDTTRGVALGGPTTTELIRDDIRTAIIRGGLLPGQAIRLRELAEAHRVRVGALATTLAGLDAEHLLTVRGDMAFVAPLNSANLLAAQRFGRLLSQAMIPRAFELITPWHLERVERLLPTSTNYPVDYAQGVVHNGAMVIATLADAAAGRADRRELRSLLDHNGRYSFFSGQVLADTERMYSALDYAENQREIVALLRAGRPTAAAQRQSELFRRLHAFEQLSLDYPRRTDEDSPIAEVIPLRRTS